MTTQEFCKALAGRLSDIRAGLYGIHQLGRLPEPQTREDVLALLELRAEGGLFGPANLPTRLAAITRLLLPDDAVQGARAFLDTTLGNAENAVLAGAELGAVIGPKLTFYAQGHWDPDRQESAMILLYRYLPAGHALREAITEADCYRDAQQGGQPVLILGRPAEEYRGSFGGTVRKASRWYAFDQIIELTREWRRQQVEQADEQAAAQERWRRQKEEDSRIVREASPRYRIEQLEVEVRRLTAAKPT